MCIKLRKECSECPWVVKNRHNNNLINNIKKFVVSGSLKDTTHVCHLMDTNIWNTVTEKNVCIGSLKNKTDS